MRRIGRTAATLTAGITVGLITLAILLLIWQGFARSAAGLSACLIIAVMPWLALWARSIANRRGGTPTHGRRALHEPRGNSLHSQPRAFADP